MTRDAKRDQEDKKRVEEESRRKEGMMGWFEPKSLLDKKSGHKNSSLFPSEAGIYVSDIQEVSCMHQFRVQSELYEGSAFGTGGWAMCCIQMKK